MIFNFSLIFGLSLSSIKTSSPLFTNTPNQISSSCTFQNLNFRKFSAHAYFDSSKANILFYKSKFQYFLDSSISIQQIDCTSFLGQPIYGHIVMNCINATYCTFSNIISDSTGGAISVSCLENSYTYIDQCTFTSCTARSDGGAIYSNINLISQSRFVAKSSTFNYCTIQNTNNLNELRGGAIYCRTEYVDFTNSTFRLCGINSNVGGCYGGAIYADARYAEKAFYHTTFINCYVTLLPPPPTPTASQSPTASLSPTPSQTPTNVFTISDIFTDSQTFTASSVFTDSNYFTPSMTFTSSFAFSASSPFTDSQTFTKSDEFTKSKEFSKSKEFTKSKEFSKSNPFSQTKEFSASKYFTPSQIFTCSNFFSKSNDFTVSDYFTKTNEFSMTSAFSNTQGFTKSIDFTDSSFFSKSEGFSKSKVFSNSDSFSKSEAFTKSTCFTETQDFTYSLLFSESVNFTNSNQFTFSQFFTNSNVFSPSQSPTPPRSPTISRSPKPTYSPKPSYSPKPTYSPKPPRTPKPTYAKMLAPLNFFRSYERELNYVKYSEGGAVFLKLNENPGSRNVDLYGAEFKNCSASDGSAFYTDSPVNLVINGSRFNQGLLHTTAPVYIDSQPTSSVDVRSVGISNVDCDHFIISKQGNLEFKPSAGSIYTEGFENSPEKFSDPTYPYFGLNVGNYDQMPTVTQPPPVQPTTPTSPPTQQPPTQQPPTQQPVTSSSSSSSQTSNVVPVPPPTATTSDSGGAAADSGSKSGLSPVAIFFIFLACLICAIGAVVAGVLLYRSRFACPKKSSVSPFAARSYEYF